MERDRSELEAILASLNRSAERLQALWISFVGLSIYFILTAMTTTHRMLLLEEPQTLPLVNLKVPLLSFYVVAPLFYLAIHFYVLLMLVLLARSASTFEAVLKETLWLESERERFRMRIENTLFLQLLSGAQKERKGINGRFLAAMALITIAMTPNLTFLVMQLQFLPYHSVVITWLHRAIVVVDLALVWLLWRGYRYRWGQIIPRSPRTLWRDRGRWWWISGPASGAGRFTALFFVVWMCLVEGRWPGEPWIDPTDGGDATLIRSMGFDFRDSTTELPIELRSNLDAWHRSVAATKEEGLRPIYWAGLFRDRLFLRNEVIVGSVRLEEIKREVNSFGSSFRFLASHDFHERDFTAADFSLADLRAVDFQSSILRKARLTSALLDGAQFDNADMAGAILFMAHANGASFHVVNLVNSDLSSAKFSGAKFATSHLECANFTGSTLQATSFDNNWMQFTQFNGADLSAAMFYKVLMPFANLSSSVIDGIQVNSSALFRVNFLNARGDSALIVQNSGYGAIGAEGDADMLRLDRSYVQYFDTTLNSAAKSLLSLPLQYPPIAEGGSTEEQSQQEIIQNERIIAEWFQKNSSCLDPTDPNYLNIEDFLTSASKFSQFWDGLVNEAKTNDPLMRKYRESLAHVLGDLACRAGEGAPFVARALIQSRLGDLGENLDSVRNRLVTARGNPAYCPGVSALTEADWQTLNSVMAN